jgi:predicted permease
MAAGILHDLLLRLRALTHRRRLDADVDDELAFHLEMRASQIESTGVDPEAARRAARRQFGNTTSIRERIRDMWSFPSAESVWRDIRYGIRMLSRAPAFTAVAVLTIALGVGANTSVFSVADAVLLRPLPFAHADRLVRLYSVVNANLVGPSAGDVRDYVTESHAFETLVPYDFWPKNVSGSAPGDRPEQMRIGLVPSEYFAAFGITPTLGRVFTADETRAGNDHVVLLSDHYWRAHFAASHTALGQTVRINEEPYTVIGVMPDAIPQWVDVAPAWHGQVAMWTPLVIPDDAYGPLRRADRGGETIGLLRPGISVQAATAEVQRIAERLASQYPADRGLSARVVPLSETRTGKLGPTLVLLLASAGMILLIACTNVASLLLARHTARRHEFVIRASLGASRFALVRQLVAEHLTLALLGGAVGLAAAWLGVVALSSLRPENLPQLAGVHMDARVLLYTLGLSLGTGVLFGIIPALPATRGNLGTAIREGGRSGTAGRRRQLEQHALVVAQIACCVVLVLWTSLLVKSLLRLEHQDSGFRSDRLLTARLYLPKSRYADAPAITRFCETFAERLRAIPGIQDGSVTTFFPPANRITRRFTIDGRAASRQDDMPTARFGVADDRYRGTVGIPLLAGRDFAESDVATNAPVVLINQALVHQYFPGRDPIGQRLRLRQLDVSSPSDTTTDLATIIGVIGNTKNRGLALDPDPEIVGLFRQMPDMNVGFKSLVVHTTAADANQVAGAIRETLRSLDPELPLAEVATMGDLMAEQTTDRRLSTTLLGLFTVSGVLLAIIGVYGVVSYFVAQRTKEIGVRVTLGAKRADILWLVLGNALRLAAAGIALGLAGAFATERLMSRFLFAVEANDPLILIGVPLAIAAIAVAACYLPARRATSLDPVLALRES